MMGSYSKSLIIIDNLFNAIIIDTADFEDFKMTKIKRTPHNKEHKTQDTSNPGNMYKKSNSQPKHLEKAGKPKTV